MNIFSSIEYRYLSLSLSTVLFSKFVQSENEQFLAQEIEHKTRKVHTSHAKQGDHLHHASGRKGEHLKPLCLPRRAFMYILPVLEPPRKGQ